MIKNGKEYQAKEIVAYIDEEIIGSEVFLKKTRGWKIVDPAFVAARILEYRGIIKDVFTSDKMRLKNKKRAEKYAEDKQIDKRTEEFFKILEEERNK